MIGNTCSFHSGVSILGTMPIFPESVICDEPSLRACTIPWALKQGGPIIRAFIEAIPEDWRLDQATVVRAMPVWLRAGWHEGHVGWHLDGVRMRADGEEAWVDGRPPAFRRIACNMGSNAPTLVIVGDLTLPAYPLGQPLTKLWSRHLDEAVAAGTIRQVAMQEGELFMLNSSSFHSIGSASRDGWRMFFDVNRPCLDGASSMLGTEDLYRELESDFQPSNEQEQALMAPYLGAARA